jgi:ATP-binding cassette subfamily B protein
MTEDKGFPGSEEKRIRLADLALAKGLVPYVRPYAWMLILTTLMVSLVTGFELLLPLLTQKAIDGFIIPIGASPGISLLGQEIKTFTGFSLLFAGVIISGFILDFCQNIFMEYTGQKIILNLRCRLFAHMTHLKVSYFDENASGRLVARAAGDIENMNEMFTSILIFIFKDLVLMAGIFVVLYFINPGLTLILSLIIPVIIISIRYFSARLREVFRTIRQKIGEINHRFSEGISGIKVIQTTMARQRFTKAFSRLNQEHFTAAMDQIRVFAVFMPFIGFLGVAATGLILWSGSTLVNDKSLTLGELVAFLTYMKLFFRPLRELSEKFNLLQNALASAERIITVLNTPKARITPSKKRLTAIHSLEFSSIDFSYTPNVPVLDKISFKLEKGKSLGIVGQTGSGKSSVINLITGFYTPDKGDILINSQSTTGMDIREIRARTALVMQDPILFSGLVRENISPAGMAPENTARNSREESRLRSALEQGNCHFLFQKFNGLDTELGEGGRPLSSGEKQLLCIARAFAFDPDLIIFDEATSYMDSRSETQVHDAMKKLMKGRLSIIIAHRLSTVRECDHILVLKQGKIVEQGSHETLAAQNGEYALLLKKEKI